MRARVCAFVARAGLFVNIPLVLPFFVAFKHYHNEHHKYQGVEGVDTDLPSELEARLLNNFPGKLFFLSMQTWHYAFRPLFVRPQAFTRWHLLNWVVQIAFIASTVHLLGWGPILYLLLCAHFSGGLHPIASHFLAEHYVFADKIETASYYGPLNVRLMLAAPGARAKLMRAQTLTWNVGYHNEHHDFPTVPWSRLPQLSQIGNYKALPHHESWTAVMWEFLTNPHVSFYNRVKRRPERGDAAAARVRKSAQDGAADYAETEWVR
jgi:sphingolipid delta-4 desaturase